MTKQEEYIIELENYVEFLAKHLRNAESFLSVQSAWSTDQKDIEEGEVRRERIKLLKLQQ